MSLPPSLPPKQLDSSNLQNQTPPLPPSERHTPSSSNPSQVIPLPESFTVLPTKEVEKLKDSLSVLRGYLLELVENKSQEKIDVIHGIIEQIDTYIKQLHNLNESKYQTNLKLQKLQSLTQEWHSIENQMKVKLARFQINELYNLLNSALIDSRNLSNSIKETFIAPNGQIHDEASIQQFISGYKSERKLYHLRFEKLQRFKENRIGDLII